MVVCCLSLTTGIFSCFKVVQYRYEKAAPSEIQSFVAVTRYLCVLCSVCVSVCEYCKYGEYVLRAEPVSLNISNLEDFCR